MSLRLFWRRFHLWIGIATGLFLLGISLSGIVLMFDDKVNKLVRPELYAISGSAMVQTPDTYFARAKETVPNGDPYQLRYPEEAGHPAIVMMRLRDARGGRSGEAGRDSSATDPATRRPDHGNGERVAAEHSQSEHAQGERGNGERRERRGNGMGGGNMTAGAPAGTMGPGGRPRVLAVYMDPPTATVLGTADPRASFVGWAHSLHADLLMPAFNGRQIVGWMGLGLFVLCATGLYLWWPRGGSFLRGLRWSRSPAVSANLHHRIGFWIVLPLCIIAFTGFIQGFPQQSRAVTAALMPMAPQPPRGGAGNSTVTPNLSLQRVLDLAAAEAPGFRPTMLAVPQETGKLWRVMAENETGDRKTLLIDDAKETVSTPPEPLQGDSVLGFLRRLHEGNHHGPVWETIVFLTALTPPVFFVTGVLMWLRRRKNMKAVAIRVREQQSSATAAAAAE